MSDASGWSRYAQIKFSVLLAIVTLAVVLSVWAGKKFFGSHEEAPLVASPPGTFKATPQQLKTLTIETVGVHAFVSEELTEGKIAVNADRATAVFSPYSGRVVRVVAGLGDVVRRGAPLAIIAASEFLQAQNDLNNANSQVKIARINETRKHALYEAKGGSLQDWQQSQSDLATAETGLKGVRDRLRILNQSDAEINALEKSRNVNSEVKLSAPIAGVVVDRQLGPGQYLQAGASTPAFTIADPAHMWLVANIRESDIARVQPGQAVEVHVLAYPNRVFKAHLSHVAVGVDPMTHRLPVRAEIENEDGALKIEMLANFRILTGDASDAPAIPESAVVYEGEAAHIWVVESNDLIAYRAIRIGRSHDGLIEIRDGVKVGDRVVTKGALFVDQAATPAPIAP